MTTKLCPFCSSKVPKTAVLCKFCHNLLIDEDGNPITEIPQQAESTENPAKKAKQALKNFKINDSNNTNVIANTAVNNTYENPQNNRQRTTTIFNSGVQVNSHHPNFQDSYTDMYDDDYEQDDYDDYDQNNYDDYSNDDYDDEYEDDYQDDYDDDYYEPNSDYIINNNSVATATDSNAKKIKIMVAIIAICVVLAVISVVWAFMNSSKHGGNTPVSVSNSSSQVQSDSDSSEDSSVFLDEENSIDDNSNYDGNNNSNENSVVYENSEQTTSYSQPDSSILVIDSYEFEESSQEEPSSQYEESSWENSYEEESSQDESSEDESSEDNRPDISINDALAQVQEHFFENYYKSGRWSYTQSSDDDYYYFNFSANGYNVVYKYDKKSGEFTE